MSFEQIKKEAEALSPKEQDDLSAFLSVLREERDPEFQAEIRRRVEDTDPSHWIKLEDVEARFQQGR